MLQQGLVTDHPHSDYEFTVDTLPLRSGKTLRNVTIAYRLHGALGKPLVFVLGGISAHRGLNNRSGNKKAWWKDVVGAGKAINSEDFCIVGIDYLGGDGQTTGPSARHWEQGTSIDTWDQAAVLNEIANILNYQSVWGIVGASYGAMVGLAYGKRYGNKLEKLIAISGAHRSHPMAMAWRYLQREILELAHLESTQDDSHLRTRLVTLSRALAMTTYRSPEEFSQRFESVEDVASYLESRGGAFAKDRDLRTYYCLSESIDRHNLDIETSSQEIHIIGFEEDRLVPTEILRELALQAGGHLHIFHSLYGHDAFLKEFGLLNRLLPKLLEGAQV